ncbi:MAG: hypothetical protein RLZZ127_445 [Planctomycetota bacterium]
MAATAARPNILLITTDQQRWDGLGIARADRELRTPHLDALAVAGMRFDRAYSTCPVCIPARRSLLTGLHPSAHGLRHYQDGLDWDPPFTLPGILARHGWQTELIGKLHLHPQDRRYGFEHQVRTEAPQDRWDSPVQKVNAWAEALRAAGHAHPYDLGLGSNSRRARPWDKAEHLHHTSWVADRAVDWLTRERDTTCPFFLHLSFWAPHPPFIPPQAYWDRYHRRHGHRPMVGRWVPDRPVQPGLPLDASHGPFDPEELHEAVAGYFGLIEHLDDRIAHVLSRLFEYGCARAKDPTLVVFTSDHGEQLGDHHLFRKSLPFESSMRVPFLISGINLPLARGTSDALVCLEDIPATVLDLCGLPLPEPLGDGVNGTSLAPLLAGGTAAPRRILFGGCGGAADHEVAIADGLKYIWWARTGEEQLFDLIADPGETTDLSGDGVRIAPLRAALAAHLGRTAPGRYDPARARPCRGAAPAALW